MKQQRIPLRVLRARMDAVIARAHDADLTTTATLLRLARLDLMLRCKGLAPQDGELLAAVLATAEQKAASAGKLPSRRKVKVPQR